MQYNDALLELIRKPGPRQMRPVSGTSPETGCGRTEEAPEISSRRFVLGDRRFRPDRCKEEGYRL